MYHEIIKQVCSKYGKKYTRELKIRLYGATDRETAMTVVNELKLPLSVDEFERQVTDIAKKKLPTAPLQKDTETMYHEIIKQVCSKYGKKYTRELKIRLYGATDRETAMTVVNELKLPLSVDEFERQVTDIAKKKLPTAPLQKGAERLLLHLHDNNIPLALATNSLEHAIHLHAQARPKLFGLFHHMVSASDPEVDRGKPQPDIYLVAANRFPEKPKPTQCLVFEDSLCGVLAGKAAGMQVVMIPDPRIDREQTREATITIRSLMDFQPELFGLPRFK